MQLALSRMLCGLSTWILAVTTVIMQIRTSGMTRGVIPARTTKPSSGAMLEGIAEEISGRARTLL